MHSWQKRDCERLLRETFGAEGFRPGQREAVETVLAGRDLLALFPTGAGKSLCYQLPALMLPGFTLVVSPLIALMQDQVRQLRRRGVAAASFDSLQTPEELNAAFEALESGRIRLAYASPERLQTQRFRALMRRLPPGLFVVDEAHCAVQWGESFRPAYAELAAFVAELPARPVICAMTATADRRMRRDIARSLGMRGTRTVTLPLLRENLRYSVKTTTDPTAEALRMAEEHAGEKGLVFCRTRRRCEELAARLRASGLSAEAYHAGMERADREAAQARFTAGETAVLAATSAFGMGVDIPNIRWTLHDALPASLTDLTQQSGRAGRDGNSADCAVLVDPADLLRQALCLRRERQEEARIPWFRPGAKLRIRLKRISGEKDYQNLLHWCLDGHCLARGIAAAFGQRVPDCGACSACRRRAGMGGVARLAPVPDLPRLDRAGVRMWALTWQRSAIAAGLRMAPVAVLSDAAMASAAETGLLPEEACDPRAYEALSRLLRRMQ